MRDPLTVELERWQSLGLVSADQARAILDAEDSRAADVGSPALDEGGDAPTAQPTARSRRSAVVAEVLGSLGAIAAGVAAVVGTAVLWPDLATPARVAIPAVGTLVLLVAGIAVPKDGDRSSERLGALLWLLAIGAVAATCVIVTTDVLEWAGQNVLLVSAGVSLALSTFLLRRAPSPHLLLAVVGSAVGVTVGLVLQYDNAQPAHVGAVLVCIGAAVVLLGWAEIVPEGSTAIVAGAVVSLVGAEMLGDLQRHWPIVAGGIVALGLLAMYVGARDRAALVSGLVVAVVVVVQGIVLLAGRGGGGAGGNRWVVLLVFALGAGVLAASIIAIRASSHSRRST